MSEILICVPHMKPNCFPCIKDVLDYQLELDRIINLRINNMNLTLSAMNLPIGGVNVRLN